MVVGAVYLAGAAWLGAWLDVLAAGVSSAVGMAVVFLDRRHPSSQLTPWLAGAGLTAILAGLGVAAGTPQMLSGLGLVALVGSYVRAGRPTGPLPLVPLAAAVPLAGWLAWRGPQPVGGQPMEVLRASGVVAFVVLTGLAYERSWDLTVARALEGQRRALKARRSRARLLERVSHALAEPLHGVLDLARGLAGERLPAAARGDLELLCASAESMLALVTELIALASAPGGEAEPAPRPRLLVLPPALAPPVGAPAADEGAASSWRQAFTSRLVGGLAGVSAAAVLAYLVLGSRADVVVAVVVLGVALAVWALVSRGRTPQATLGGATALAAAFAAGGALSGSPADLGYLGVAALAMLYVGGGARRGQVLGLMGAGFAVAAVGALWRPGPQVPTLDVLRAAFVVACIVLIARAYEVARRQALAEALAAQGAAEAAAAWQERLLEAVSHQLRTPLNGILGMAQTLWGEVPTAAQREAVERLARGATAMHARVNELLDAARSGAGEVMLAPAPVEVAVLLEDVAALSRPAAERKGLALVATLPPRGAWVLADESRLRQVLGALLSNALACTPRGQVGLAGTLGSEGGPRLTVEVTDQGPGLPPGLAEALAQPRVEVGQGGAGLGLAVAHELARAMGGTLTVASTGPGGSTLRLEVPLPPAPPPAQPSPRPAPRPVRVLVVDDNLVNLTVAARLVSRLGAEAVLAGSGEAALALASADRFDLVLMDLQMPGLDGFETTRRLRAQGLAAPVVALTASAQPETPGQCRAAGMAGCLVKPVKLEQLAGLLDGLQVAGGA